MIYPAIFFYYMIINIIDNKKTANKNQRLKKNKLVNGTRLTCKTKVKKNVE